MYNADAVGDKHLRFSAVLIAGTIIFIMLQFALPVFLFTRELNTVFAGFVVGLVVGSLTKDLRKGILGGLLSIFLGPMVSGFTVAFFLSRISPRVSECWFGVLRQVFGRVYLL